MILLLFSLYPHRHITRHNAKMERLSEERYGGFLHQPLTACGEGRWFSCLKPYHAEIIPYLALDLFICLRNVSCQLFCGHDLLPFGDATPPGLVESSPHVLQLIEPVFQEMSLPVSCLICRGFGARMDVGINALGAHYVDMIGTLTQVEAEVLTRIRELQFEKYRDPRDLRTFGLQKLAAGQLEKSPVAVHKSLKSAKYPLIVRTAIAMRDMLQ